MAPDEPKFLGAPPPDGPAPATKPSSSSASPRPLAPFDLRAQCQAGEAADALLVAGQLERAEAAYQALLDRVFTKGATVQAYVVGKAVLGLLLARLARGDLEGAHAVWTAKEDRPAWKLGILAIEQGQLGAHDSALYRHASAVMHAYTPDRKVALAAVNREMAILAVYAAQHEPALLAVIAESWPKRLEAIFETPLASIPAPAKAAYVQWHQGVGRLGAPQRAALAPAPWR